MTSKPNFFNKPSSGPAGWNGLGFLALDSSRCQLFNHDPNGPMGVIGLAREAIIVFGLLYPSTGAQVASDRGIPGSDSSGQDLSSGTSTEATRPSVDGA